MKTLIIIFVIFLLTALHNSCSVNKGTNPPPKSGPDTSSHNFIWQVDTLPGTVLDIDGLDENNAWAVGHFIVYHNDSANTYTYYNIARWDGLEWVLFDVGISGQLSGIKVFGKDDIWVTSGAARHWNGSSWTLYHFWNMGVLNNDEGGVKKIWGTSSSDLYFIGNKGTIVQYDGTTFKKMESNTTINLKDIYALDNEHIWVVGDDRGLQGGHSVLLFYDGNSWQVKYHYRYNQGPPVGGGPEGNYAGIWTDRDSLIMATGDGYWHESIESGKSRIEAFPFYPFGFVEKIFAQKKNDLFMVGHSYTIHHFNGKSWKRYIPYDGAYLNFYTGMFISENCVFIGGDAYIYRGYR